MGKLSEFYNFHELLSRNGTYNFVVGARGVGKTYGAKKHVIRKFIEKGDEFIYLRRYSTELKDRDTWFNDIAHEFPDYVFRVVGNRAQCKLAAFADDKKTPWDTMGYFVQLSNAAAKKSVPYPKVRWILYDEFIIEKGNVQYLVNEVKVFNDFFSTVDRYQDKTRVIFMANNISIMNPYFLEFKIRPNENDTWLVSHGGFIVVHLPDSDTFKREVYSTKFGRFIEGTDYGAYSVEGTFKDNSNTLIGLKDSTFDYLLTLETRDGIISLWVNRDLTACHVSDYRPRADKIWVVEPELMGEGKILRPYSDRILSMARAMYSNGQMTFNSPQARNAFIQIWKRR